MPPLAVSQARPVRALSRRFYRWKLSFFLLFNAFFQRFLKFGALFVRIFHFFLKALALFLKLQIGSIKMVEFAAQFMDLIRFSGTGFLAMFAPALRALDPLPADVFKRARLRAYLRKDTVDFSPQSVFPMVFDGKQA